MLLSIAIAAATTICPTVGSTFALDTDPRKTMTILEIPSNKKTLYLTFSDESGKRLWFTLDVGSAESSIRLVSSKSDPGLATWKPQEPDTQKDREFQDIRYFLFRSSGRLANESSIRKNALAPEAIFIPDLPERLYYKRNPSLPDHFWRGIFIRKSCGRAI